MFFFFISLSLSLKQTPNKTHRHPIPIACPSPTFFTISLSLSHITNLEAEAQTEGERELNKLPKWQLIHNTITCSRTDAGNIRHLDTWQRSLVLCVNDWSMIESILLSLERVWTCWWRMMGRWALPMRACCRRRFTTQPCREPPPMRGEAEELCYRRRRDRERPCCLRHRSLANMFRLKPTVICSMSIG